MALAVSFAFRISAIRLQGDDVIGNLQRMQIDAGVLYYVMVLAEDTANADQAYRLEVFESLN